MLKSINIILNINDTSNTCFQPDRTMALNVIIAGTKPDKNQIVFVRYSQLRLINHFSISTAINTTLEMAAHSNNSLISSGSVLKIGLSAGT
jgi:hypothetical protein